jgi:hypothetical protein
VNRRHGEGRQGSRGLPFVFAREDLAGGRARRSIGPRALAAADDNEGAESTHAGLREGRAKPRVHMNLNSEVVVLTLSRVTSV